MKAQLKPKTVNDHSHWHYIYIGLLIIILQTIFHLSVDASTISTTNHGSRKDTLSKAIQKLLADAQVTNSLNFPQSVKRCYALNANGGTIWVKGDENIRPILNAMLLLDCVRQYGLNRINYHPKELTYSSLHDVLSEENLASSDQKAMFDILLTDAMLSMINHLHYGMFNPALPSKRIDVGNTGDLNAEVFLLAAFKQTDLRTAILTVQPKSKSYIELQGYMRLITGQYICDSYEVPEAQVQHIAINMERLKWANLDDTSSVQVNIPSFTLTFKQPDTAYEFKVVVGKAKNPTPTLQSKISYLETAPDWRVPQSILIKEFIPKALKDSTYFDRNHMAVYDNKEDFIKIGKNTLDKIKLHPENYHARQTAGCDNALGKVVFRFANTFDIYLHDSPEQQLFEDATRAYSHGCIRVEKATMLAELMLKADLQETKITALRTAMDQYTKKTFLLKKPVPIIITYLTCTVKDGLLQYHDDIYKLDDGLALKMFGTTDQFTKN